MKALERLSVLTLIAGFAAACPAQDQVFSGPQVGEILPPFKVRGVFDEEAGQEFDFVTRANGKPIVLIFMHDVNRQSVSLTRLLSQYTLDRAKDGVETGVVWLNDDLAEAESQLKRIRHALPQKVPVGVSIDGGEGPGTYGLNRNVALTILIGKQGKVTGNFALIQPSVQADLPDIVASVVAVAGGDVPKLEELTGPRDRLDLPTAETSTPNLRPLLAPLIRRGAMPEEVHKAAAAVTAHVAEDPIARKELGRIATSIVRAGKLNNYGTPVAQEYLQKWAKEYGSETSAGEPPAPVRRDSTKK